MLNPVESPHLASPSQKTERNIMGEFDGALAAISRTVAKGSKLGISGAMAAISANVIYVLKMLGIEFSSLIKVWSLTSLPPNYAAPTFILLSSLLGWMSWLYFSQSRRLMRRLEF